MPSGRLHKGEVTGCPRGTCTNPSMHPAIVMRSGKFCVLQSRSPASTGIYSLLQSPSSLDPGIRPRRPSRASAGPRHGGALDGFPPRRAGPGRRAFGTLCRPLSGARSVLGTDRYPARCRHAARRTDGFGPRLGAKALHPHRRIRYVRQRPPVGGPWGFVLVHHR